MNELEYERYILSTRPTLWMPFYRKGGDVIVSSDGYGHIATVTGASWGIQGRQCDGVDDVIHIPDHTSLKFGTGDFTVSIWVKTSQSVGAGVYPIFFSKDDEIATRRGWSIYQINTSNKVVFSVLANTIREIQSISAINDGIFHLLTLVKGAVNYEGFVDNVSQGTDTIPVGTTDKAIQVNIGGNDNADRWSSGLFGEAWIYSRALSSNEIDRNYLASQWRYR